ncbi:MAG TPA: BON domain-containing protein [Burkholderiaceae bacterium]|nr:BON domain-containing protein [Burkholderiaceae bacterium]
MSSTPPVDPSVAAGGATPAQPAGTAAGGPRPDSTDDAARHPPSRSADPGQSSYGGYYGEDTAKQPQPKARDDDQLADALRERLKSFGDVDVERVRIDVEDGRVSLSGDVADDAARRMIEARVAEVLGVTGVDNRLGTARS